MVTKQTLLAKNLICDDNKPIAWEKRQFDSDTSNARVSKHREKKKQLRNVTVATMKRLSNAPETETETETETEKTLSGKPDVPIVNGKRKLSEECNEVLSFLNQKTGKQFKPVNSNIGIIASRLREGFTVADCRMVIARKCREWLNDADQCKYLRPKTIFNATNFANYQGEIIE